MKSFKLLSVLLIGIIGLIGFGYCDIYQARNYYINGKSSRDFDKGDCIHFDNYNCKQSMTITINGNNYNYSNNVYQDLFCFEDAGTVTNSSSSSCLAYTYHLGNKYGTCPICQEQYTSEECQQEYSLMPISSCNLEYCNANGYCSEYSGSLSELYINGISHLSAPLINITIPFDIPWDYNLTGNIFDLRVLGNSGDQEYIEGLINVNSYRPTSEDFTQTFVGGLTLIFPYIIITAMVLFLWRFIKKIFK